MLMQQPDYLVGMGRYVGGKSQTDYPIDSHTTGFGQIQKPASQYMVGDAARGVMFERDTNQFGLMPRRGESLAKIIGQDLRITPDKWRS